jgi:hypothetical protein
MYHERNTLITPMAMHHEQWFQIPKLGNCKIASHNSLPMIKTLFLKTIHASTMLFETLKYDDIYSMKKKSSTNFVTLEL